MQIRNYFLLLFLLFAGVNPALHAQMRCGTQITANHLNTTENAVPGYFGCNSINTHQRGIQITVHIVRDSLGNNNYSPTLISSELTALNELWSPTGIHFLICDLRYIPNFQFDEFQETEDLDNLLALHHQPNTINLYLVESIQSTANGAVWGMAGMPGDSDYIIIDKDRAQGDAMTLAHQMGHFFGLYHTFENNFGSELVNGSNCETSGDLICDTEANPSNDASDISLPDCNYTGSPAKDSNEEFYIPPTNNIMSFSGCACRFTPQQYNRMLEQYLQFRSYLW